MGKSDFPTIYRCVKETHGKVSCKVSYYSDLFNENNNYAGIIIYGVNGKTNWRNVSGQAAGQNGRSFYLIIKNTAKFPNQRDVGSGRVHYYPLEQVLGEDIRKSDILCGGFSYHQGTLKFSSIWLNENVQFGFDGYYSQCDGSKYLSKEEKMLVRFCWNQYKRMGPDAIFAVPRWLENKILY